MRILCVIVCLLCWGTSLVRAGSSGAAFVYKSDEHGQFILTPMIAPHFSAELKSGPREINKNEALVCKQGTEITKALVGGQEAQISEFILTCGGRVFVLKGVRFEE